MPGNDKTRSAPGVWSIMRPVQGQIRFAMGLAGLAAASALGALCALAWAVHALLAAPSPWPWPPLLLAAGLTVLAFVLRLNAFNQSHYAAFAWRRGCAPICPSTWRGCRWAMCSRAAPVR